MSYSVVEHIAGHSLFSLMRIDIPVENLAKRLWGNVWFNYQTRRFEGKTADTRSPRSFVQFCLEPM